jgi:hypothetical protein
MSDQASGGDAFELGEGFTQGEISGGLGLGPLELQYEELFAEALEDGIITSEERARLEKAADNLGLDRRRLLKLEQAMMSAYQVRYKVKIVEHFEEPAASIAPFNAPATGAEGSQMLLKQIEQLTARVKELEDELRRARAAVNVEVDLSDLESSAADATEDPDEAWRRVRRDPTSVEALRSLYRIYSAREDLDKRWCVAQALAALGAANDDEKACFDQHKSPTLIAPRGSVTQQAWLGQLSHPEQEALTGQIFSLIAPAALLGRVTALRREGALHQPAPETRQDPAKATITAVRAVPWAAALLGLAPPPIFLGKDRDVGYEHIPAVPPLTLIGKRVLSGLSQNQHAFAIGRHLAMYRSEHFVKTLFSAIPDLEDLFLAALTVGNPGLPIAQGIKDRVTPIARAIEPMLEPPQLDALKACFLRFVEEGGRTNLQRWSASVDKTACRTGMLLCNDLTVAIGALEEEEGKLGELARDLIVFVTSDRYFKLRDLLGIRVDQN